jgi:hypothetical protein
MSTSEKVAGRRSLAVLPHVEKSYFLNLTTELHLKEIYVLATHV